MSKQDDGGPAFPCEIGFGSMNDNMHQTGNTVAAWYGMSLRDHFAGLAMQAVMTSAGPTWRDSGYKPKDGLSIMENNARLAYQAADAMLKARQA